jgi:choice-of-anchor B domain-containing protein
MMGLVTQAQESLNMTLLSNLDYGNDLSDIWGYATADGEYALVGVYDGISVVDVSNPALPTELEFFPGPGSIWRDLKTWGDYLYCINESGAGLQIVNLSEVISGVLNPTYVENTSLGFTTAHNIFIDENGVLYVFGSNYGVGGAAMYDLVSDPENPTFLGVFDDYYFHDGMVRGDTMYAGCIYGGKMHIVDVSDKSNPQTLGEHSTPNNFTHNAWVSDDGDFVFTTDEQSGAYLTAYDVSDLNNIQEVDRIQSNPGSGSIPHNTHVDGNFLITSYYRDGTTVHDITYPDNMIQVAYYDSYSGSGNGFDGCWGTYPFFAFREYYFLRYK